VRSLVSLSAALALAGACTAIGAGTSVRKPSSGYTGWHASWSTDRTEVAYVRRSSRLRDDAPFVQTVLGTPDRRGWRVVANRKEADEDTVYYESPSLSPDGRQVAYGKRMGERGDWQVYVAGTYGPPERRLTEGGDNVEPAWSPRGDTIAFTHGDYPAAGEIRLIRPDGGGERTLTDGRSPAWAPDGRKLAFVRANGSIRSIDVDDGTERELARGSSPAWSPDGKKIAFVRGRRISPSGPSYLFLYLMNADGTGVREVGFWDRFADWERWANPVPAFTDAADTPGPLDLRKVVAKRRGALVLIRIETERAWKPAILRRAARLVFLLDARGDGRPDFRGHVRLRNGGLVLKFSGRRDIPPTSVPAPHGSTLEVSFSVRQIAKRRPIRVAVETSFRGLNCPRACQDRLPEGGWLSTQYR